MKKFAILASLLLGFVTGSVQAGEEVYKQVAPPAPPPLYGTGFYGAIDAGANVYQNIDILNRTFADDDPNSFLFGSSVELNQKHDVGFSADKIIFGQAAALDGPASALGQGPCVDGGGGQRLFRRPQTRLRFWHGRSSSHR